MTHRRATWLFFTFAVLYITGTRGHFVGTDEIGVYQQTRSMWERGDLTVGRIVNTFDGRGGLNYSQYSIGQSIAALPLYGIGKGVNRLLKVTHNGRIAAAIAGPGVGDEPSRWGGDIEIFFVNLFNCFVTAAICAVFFVFAARLGAGARAALISTLLLGLTSYVAPFSAGFLQHPSEALFLLVIFYALFRNADKTSLKWRVVAGLGCMLMIVFRFQSVIALPVFAAYAAWTVRRRRGSIVRESLPVAISIVVGLLIHFSVNYLKFGSVMGRFNNEGFHTPLLKGLYGFLLSTGDSLFIFTPVLLLLPWMMKPLFTRYRAEAYTILALAVTYLIFYAKYTAWHGLWSALGPRYILPVVPLLLLPLGMWIEVKRRRAILLITPLALLGLWAQVLHFAVNFSYVYHFEKWPEYQPPYSFLFVPESAPIAAFNRAFLAHDFRTDVWLANVYRYSGGLMLAAFLLPLVTLLALCVWLTIKSFKKTA